MSLDSLITRISEVLPEGSTLGHEVYDLAHVVTIADSVGEMVEKVIDIELESALLRLIARLEGQKVDPEAVWSPPTVLPLTKVNLSDQPGPEDLDPAELRAVYDRLRVKT